MLSLQHHKRFLLTPQRIINLKPLAYYKFEAYLNFKRFKRVRNQTKKIEKLTSL